MSEEGNGGIERQCCMMGVKSSARKVSPLTGYASQSFHVFKFLVAGIPAFLLALGLNYTFVSVFCLPKDAAYAIVLFIQVSINFFMCRIFVFVPREDTSIWRQYFHFLIGIALFRFADWGVYVIVVEIFGVYFMIVQLANTAFFSLLKYFFARSVIHQGTFE